MHLTSSTNSSYKGENIDVAIFCYGEQRKFIRVSEDYQDTVSRVVQAFGIVGNTRILFQTSTFEVCKGKETVIDESAYPLMWNALDEVQVVVDENPAAVPQKDVEPLPTPVDSLPNNSDNERDAVKHSTIRDASEVGDTEQADGLREEERPTETIDEFAPEEEMEVTFKPRQTKDQKPVMDKRTAKGSMASLKFKPATLPTMISPESDDVASQFKKEKIASPVPYRVPDLPKQGQSSRSRNELADLTSPDDPRFEIVITGPDNSSAHFKTRGKHPVRKVLSAACKNFGIRYERAHLVLVLTFDEDDGVHTEHFICPPEDTMSKCGVTSDSKLFIKIDSDEENGDSD